MMVLLRSECIVRFECTIASMINTQAKAQKGSEYQKTYMTNNMLQGVPIVAISEQMNLIQ